VATTSTLSRRTSEFAGVALFAISLIWLIALVTHEPADPVWFFTAGDSHPAANFVGLVGAFISEVSLQVLGYASFLGPAVAAVAGWSLFWCRAIDSAYTKSFGAAMFLGCLGALFALIVGNAEVNGRTFRAGGYIGEWIADACTAYLNRPGAIIVVLTLLALSVITATQFSFGRAFAALFKAVSATGSRLITQFQSWREERRRDAERREVIAKHTRKNGGTAAAAAEVSAAVAASRTREKERAEKSRERPRADEIEDDEDESPAASMPPRRPSMTPPPIARKEQKAGPWRGRCRWSPGFSVARRSSAAWAATRCRRSRFWMR
jgi:S-DNA-T family DNA segregation ATPase FtsK/SpoIIIE